jgi:DNA processing protein
MAVPGNINSPVSVGTNRLLRDGATPVLESNDLLLHFSRLPNSGLTLPAAPSVSRPLPPELSQEEKALASLFNERSLHPDELSTRLNRPVGEVLGLLCGLEIAGVIEQGPGRMFRRV